MHTLPLNPLCANVDFTNDGLLCVMWLRHVSKQRKWGQEVMLFDWPHELAVILYSYVGAGHKELCLQHNLIGNLQDTICASSQVT